MEQRHEGRLVGRLVADARQATAHARRERGIAQHMAVVAVHQLADLARGQPHVQRLQPVRHAVAAQAELHEVVAAAAGDVDQETARAVRRAQQGPVGAEVERRAVLAAHLAAHLAFEEEGQQQLAAGLQLHAQVLVEPEVEVQRLRTFPGRRAHARDVAAASGPAHAAAGLVVAAQQRQLCGAGRRAEQRSVEIVLAPSHAVGLRRCRRDLHSLLFDWHSRSRPAGLEWLPSLSIGV